MLHSVTLLQSIVLGAVQGLTEFLPISSSAHLALVPWFLHWPDQGLAFDMALHLGTLLAIVMVLGRDYLRLDRRLIGYLLIGTVPGAAAGYWGEEWFVAHFRSPLTIAILLGLFGIVMGLVDRLGSKDRALTDLSLPQAFGIGCAQALALMPGVSRSGATLTAALLCGLNREHAAKYAFLLGGPILAGASVHEGMKLVRSGLTPSELLIFLAGLVTSAGIGALCVNYLLKYLKTKSLSVFVGYRIALALLITGLLWGRGGRGVSL